MKFFTTKDKTQIFYKDIGDGAPVILIHGWPLNADMWEDQTLALQKVALVGFSMGGGEVARFLKRYGTSHVSSAILISAITPIVMNSSSNPKGVPEDVINQISAGVRKDRFAFFHHFFKDFYGISMVSHPTTDATLAWAETVAAQASLRATLKCIDAFGRTDFRDDMQAFKIPTLIIHGTGDKTVPIETSADQAANLVPGAAYKKYEGAPHGLNITHKDQLNKDLVDFLQTYSAKNYERETMNDYSPYEDHSFTEQAH